VLYEIEKDGVIIQKEWLTLKVNNVFLEIQLRKSTGGNLGIHYTFSKDDRLYCPEFYSECTVHQQGFDISSQASGIKLLPGASEEWKILIKGKTADKIRGRVVATSIEASLDEIRANNWYASFY